jgi:hypothetical protein
LSFPKYSIDRIMKIIARTAFFTVIVAVVGLVFAMGLKAQSKGPVYAVIDISETMDPEAYIKAVSAVEPKATQSAGGRFVVRTSKAMTLDGDPASQSVCNYRLR